jgi:hypothetical protein
VAKAKVDVDISDAKVAAAARDEVRRNVNVIGREVAREARRIAPERTGRLKRNIHARNAKFTGPLTAESEIYVRVRYAKFVIGGTRPHIIRARRAKALHFQMDGRDIFAKSVQHPGTRPNNFIGRAARTVALRRRATR